MYCMYMHHFHSQHGNSWVVAAAANDLSPADCVNLPFCLAYSAGWSVHSKEPKLTIASILQSLNVVLQTQKCTINYAHKS